MSERRRHSFLGITSLPPNKILKGSTRDNFDTPSCFTLSLRACEYSESPFSRPATYIHHAPARPRHRDYEIRQALLGHRMPGMTASYSHGGPEWDEKRRKRSY